MLPTLIPDLPEPEWLALLRAQVAKGRTISEVSRESGIARSSLSMLIAGTYPAQSLDLVTRKHGTRIMKLYRDQVLCPHQRRGIGADRCRELAETPMSTSNPEKLAQWRACRRCSFNPVAEEIRR